MIFLMALQRPAAPDSRPVILAFGDSLTAGYNVPPGSGYPERLQRKLDALGYKYRVVGMGISGDTTSGGLARLKAGLDQRPAMVILELGANDGLRGLPVPRMKSNLDDMIAAFQKTGAKVILAGMTLPPNYGEAYVKSFEEAFRDLAKNVLSAPTSFHLSMSDSEQATGTQKVAQGIGQDGQRCPHDLYHDPRQPGSGRLAESI